MLLYAVLAAALSPSLAALEVVFDNTVVSTYPDGRQAKAWLNRDGTWRGHGRSGKANSGRWTLKGDRVCLRQSRPAPLPIAYCTALKTGGVGTTWSGKAVTGEPVRFELVAGRP